MHPPLRLAILGNSGSGKSTLARWCADRIGGVTLLDLDTVAWEPGKVAVARTPEAARRDVGSFCRDHDAWVIEGCYAELIQATFAFSPRLIFLDPGLESCLENCRSRPWEPHKYASRSEQDEHLHFLLEWVGDYYTREGDLSWAGHRACFDAYRGQKFELTSRPDLEQPSPELLALLK